MNDPQDKSKLKQITVHLIALIVVASVLAAFLHGEIVNPGSDNNDIRIAVIGLLAGVAGFLFGEKERSS